MTQEDKELLLKDLCARLPYGVKVESVFINPDTKEHKSCGIEVFDATSILMIRDGLGEFKPYLFPLSSMTEEQYKYISYNFGRDGLDYIKYGTCDFHSSTLNIEDIYELVDWLHKNHFDYRGLISMGLANDASGLNIY